MHNCIQFNQDATCFGCAGENGFVVYNCDPIVVRFAHLKEDNSDAIKYISLLNKSNIIAFVKSEQLNTVCIWNDHKNSICAEILFQDDIITGIKLSTDYVLISSIKETCLYSFKDNMGLIKKIDTVPNINGVIDLCNNASGTVLVVYLSNNIGEIVLNDLNSEPRIIKAHTNNISNLCLNKEGTILATVSERGTLIRIWDVKTLELLKEFRRGIDTTNITSLCFNKIGTQLLVCSEKGTMHVFYLDKQNRKSTLSYFSSMLPEYFDSEWSSVSVQVEPLSICHFSYTDQDIIYVIEKNASIFKKYRLNVEENTCLLISDMEFYKK